MKYVRIGALLLGLMALAPSAFAICNGSSTQHFQWAMNQFVCDVSCRNYTITGGWCKNQARGIDLSVTSGTLSDKYTFPGGYPPVVTGGFWMTDVTGSHYIGIAALGADSNNNWGGGIIQVDWTGAYITNEDHDTAIRYR